MTPLGDGYQQIQDPCAAVSNFIEPYNLTELYKAWQIFQDPTAGLKLHLFQFDGAPLAPQFLVSATPNMLPTQLLRNVTPPAPAPSLSRRTSAAVQPQSWTLGVTGATGLTVAGIILALF